MSLAFLALLGAYQYFIAYGRNDDVWWSLQAPYVEGAREILRLPADAVVLHEPFLYGRTSFEFLTRDRHSQIRIVRTASDLEKWVQQRPFHMLFIGRDRLGADFLRLFPDAQRKSVIELPSGLPVGVLYEVP
jgi:hypothetical protein